MKVDLKKTVASALSFAHLAGIGGKAAAKGRAEDEDEKDKAESDDKDTDAKGSRAEGDEKDKPEDDDKGSKAGADDDYDAEGEDDDSEKDDKKSKKSKASDDDKKDEDPDDEMRGSSAAAVARRREQARCAAIFASNHAARNPVLAANLAFKTRMSRTEALAVLEATPASAAAPGNASRASRNPSVGAGGGTEPSSRQKVEASWDAAFKRASPRR